MKYGLMFFGSAFAAVMVTLAGCEVESANRRIEVRPDSAVLKYHESVTLSANNGYVYRWSLSDNTIGALSTRSGQQTVYTSLTDPATPVIQVVTVTSTFSDNVVTNDSGTNSSPSVYSAEAYITHIPSTNLNEETEETE